MGLSNATCQGPSAKLVHFKTQIATFVGIWETLLRFETQIAAFMEISKKLLLYLLKVLHFLGNWQICYFYYKLYKIKAL